MHVVDLSSPRARSTPRKSDGTNDVVLVEVLDADAFDDGGATTRRNEREAPATGTTEAMGKPRARSRANARADVVIVREKTAMTPGSARGGTRGRRARARVHGGEGADGASGASGGRGTCAVCLDAYVLPTTTRCGHVFCARCLQAALRHSSQCPTCRKKVTKSSCVRVFL